MKTRTLALLLMAPMLMAGKCDGHRKDKDKEEPQDTGDKLPPPSVKLMVAGIDPAVSPPGQGFDADVLGSAFERGATVTISGRAVGSVTWRSSALLQISVPALEQGTYDVTVTNPDGTEATLRRGLTIMAAANAGCPQVTVHFELDSVGLFPSDLASLRSAAECWRNESSIIRVEGHCDERGTTEYNLALGQRRSDAVTNYLLSLGIPKSRIRSTSYGEERPVATGHDEASWSANRRADAYAER